MKQTRTAAAVAKVERIAKHIDNIINIYGGLKFDKITTYKKLRRIECKMQRAAEGCANGIVSDEQMNEMQSNAVRLILNLFVNPENIARDLWINTDPRGYALKLGDDMRKSGIFTDWGGYGILAPEF